MFDDYHLMKFCRPISVYIIVLNLSALNQPHLMDIPANLLTADLSNPCRGGSLVPSPWLPVNVNLIILLLHFCALSWLKFHDYDKGGGWKGQGELKAESILTVTWGLIMRVEPKETQPWQSGDEVYKTSVLRCRIPWLSLHQSPSRVYRPLRSLS